MKKNRNSKPSKPAEQSATKIGMRRLSGLPAKYALFAGIAVIALCGVAHGVLTARWGAAHLAEASARLANVPLTIGDWDAEELEFSPKVLKRAEATGGLNRKYTNRHSGNTLTVTIVCGRPGPIAVHPPTVCFVSGGIEQVEAEKRFSPNKDGADGANVFWSATFGTKHAVPVHHRALWAWSAAGTWTAPDNPRLEFARFPFLYKLYVVETLADKDEAISETTTDFVQRLLRELNTALFAQTATTEADR
jgi:hypothetical protein